MLFVRLRTIEPNATVQMVTLVALTIIASLMSASSILIVQTILPVTKTDTVWIPASVLPMPIAVHGIMRAFAPAEQATPAIPTSVVAQRVRMLGRLQGLVLLSILQLKLLVPPPPPPGCTGDVECPSQLACFSGECKNPCLVTRPCVQNADCKVYDTLPRRTMTCTCRDKYVGRGDERCEKESKTNRIDHADPELSRTYLFSFSREQCLL